MPGGLNKVVSEGVDEGWGPIYIVWIGKLGKGVQRCCTLGEGTDGGPGRTMKRARVCEDHDDDDGFSLGFCTAGIINSLRC
jgi:hypothetical protein